MIEPTIPQDDFIFSELRFPAIVAGFGAGKTQALVDRSIIMKLQFPTVNQGFYEPTYDLIRQIAWPRYEEILETNGIAFKLRKSPHNCIDLPGRGRIIFRSMDTPQRIIGYEHGDAFVDELDTLKRDDAMEVWRRVLSRNRQRKPYMRNGAGVILKDAEGRSRRHPNTAAVATTPEGFKFVYDRWYVNEQGDPNYGIITAPTYSNPHLPPEYIQNLRDDYPPELIDAYIEGRFVNLTSGTVYRNFNRETHLCDIVEREDEMLHLGMDFNINKMAVVVHVERKLEWKGEERVCPVATAEIKDGMDTEHVIQIIRQRWPQNPITVYPDASGSHGTTSGGASKSDITLLKSAGFRVAVDAANPLVKDRVNSMNAAFNNGYRVNGQRCPYYVRCLEQQTYDKNGVPDKTQDLDHPNDAGGYFIHKKHPLLKPVARTGIGTAR